MVLVMILFIYVSVMWNCISVMTSTLQNTMCFHHHGSGYDFIHIRVCYVEPYQCHDINITEDSVFHHHGSGYDFIDIRVCYVEPYQCHDINITEDNVFSSSWFWLWFYSYTCLLCGTVLMSWHQHYRRQWVVIIMVLAMILVIYVLFLGYEDVSTWKCFSQHTFFVRGIHRSPADALCKGQSC